MFEFRSLDRNIKGNHQRTMDQPNCPPIQLRVKANDSACWCLGNGFPKRKPLPTRRIDQIIFIDQRGNQHLRAREFYRADVWSNPIKTWRTALIGDQLT